MLNNQPRALEGQLSPTFEEGKTSLYVKTLRLQGTGISAQPDDCRSLDRRAGFCSKTLPTPYRLSLKGIYSRLPNLRSRGESDGRSFKRGGRALRLLVVKRRKSAWLGKICVDPLR